MTKQSYTPKFKQDAIQYYLDHRDHMKLSEIAAHLGIGSDILHKWVKKHQGSGNYASDKDKEIAQLKRKLRDAESTIEILKKSIGILK